MKSVVILIAILFLSVSGCKEKTREGDSSATTDHAEGSIPHHDQDFVFTVGTNSKGDMIQQLEWLYETEKLKKTKCAIRPASHVRVIKETDDCVKIQCDKTALTDQKKWNNVILKGNIVVGWIQKDQLRKIKLSDWNKRKRNTQQEDSNRSADAVD